MANNQQPFGLRPVRHMDGTPWNGTLQRAYISASYATALFIGDPVLWTPTLAEKDATGKYPTINVSAGTAGTIIRGVICGFEPTPADLTKQYSPASTEGWALIAPAADDLIFQVRDDGGGSPTKVFPGQNAVLTAGSGGSTTTGLSSFALAAGTTPTTTQNYTLHILGLSDIENNELDDYAVWDVLINTNNNTTGRFLGITAV